MNENLIVDLVATKPNLATALIFYLLSIIQVLRPEIDLVALINATREGEEQ